MIENILSIVLMSVLFFWVITDIILNKEEKKAYIVCAVLIIGIVLAEICCSLYDNTTENNRIKSIIANMLGFSLAPFVFTVESYVYDKSKTFFRFVPAILNLIVVLISLFNGWIFRVDLNNIYSRGPLYFIFILCFVASIFLSLVAKMKTVNFYPGYFKIRIILSCIIMLLGITFQLVFPDYHSTWIIISVFFILDYTIKCEINSMVDGLTGLLNKNVFNKQIRLLRVKENSNYYILIMDINDFKIINDKKGHLYGDKCLCEISSVLKYVFKKRANIFRFGGDEFCVLINAQSEITLHNDVEMLNSEFLKCKEKFDFFPEVAIGYAKFKPDLMANEIIDLADFNMYIKKNEMKQKNDIVK